MLGNVMIRFIVNQSTKGPLPIARQIFNNYKELRFNFSTAILGIETSCDDTGCAVINEDGKILGEALHSQNVMHLRHGGIIPDIAQDLHRANIEHVVAETLRKSSLTVNDLTAIAVTLEPGLPLSLVIGMKYAKYLAKKYNKPLIPIHHMEAHALVVRKDVNIEFPFLVLLISGGHCLLAIAQDVNKYLLLGESMDCAPGEIFDKVARRMKLKNIPEYSSLCGGRAIELAASKSKDPNKFQLPLPLAEYKDCNFSFNGLKTATIFQLQKKEKENETVGDSIIPEANDLCAALLKSTSRHLIHRVQRAVQFCEIHNLIPNNSKNLVVSGGVASNDFIYNALSLLCKEINFNIYRPEPKLCTDNGVMIAWNGLEKWKKNIDIVYDTTTLDIKAVSPLGTNAIDEVIKSNIQTKLVKLKF